MIEFLIDRRHELIQRIAEHLLLTGGSVGLALAIGLPMGVWVRRWPKTEGAVLGTVGVLQTVPGLALLTLLMVLISQLPELPVVGRIPALGTAPAVAALTLYSLLPITLNTVVGLRGVPGAAIEAAEAMGMTRRQRLRLVELPLALPVIVAGARTATVIGVGMATLAAFIGAGGLGTFINRGLYMSQHRLVLLGAVPAALLAISLDQLIAVLETLLIRGPDQAFRARRAVRGLLLSAIPLAALAGIFSLKLKHPAETLPVSPLRAGFTGEFIERLDGLKNLQSVYGFRFSSTMDMEASLMYRALARKEVDIISAYSTDGRLDSFDVQLLDDDRHFFPPYYAAPVARLRALQETPGLEEALNSVAGRIDAAAMRRLNFEVDRRKRRPKEVALEFLNRRGLLGSRTPSQEPPVVIGSKSFTEGILLGEILALLIESRLGRKVERRFGLGGTIVVHQALAVGAIDLYAEYTGTALTAILELPSTADPEQAYRQVSRAYPERFASRWLKPFGFNNTYALGVRHADAEKYSWKRISDLRP
ncbi:MAG: ABC transporter permease/substrate-binding protein [Elusimicrobia bacterium]|nr:ABC transporter permease/substrate-binding protein [Elusimicrobiota bacterium]